MYLLPGYRSGRRRKLDPYFEFRLAYQAALSEQQMLTLEINALAAGLGIEGFPEPLSPKPGALVRRIIDVAAVFAAASKPEQAISKLEKDRTVDPHITAVLSKLWKSKQLPDIGDTDRA